MNLAKYSFGMGDRFLHQGRAQLQAVINAKDAGVEITPVWNKSNREHLTVGTGPQSLRDEADNAVKAMNWRGEYRVDADHINLLTVDPFIDCSDFFTIDVADAIGQPASPEDIADFVSRHRKYVGTLKIPNADSYNVAESDVEAVARQFLYAAQQAGEIFHYIQEKKGSDFIAEVSMDETDSPQTPLELFFILAALADQNVPLQTIAPKFTGRFNKGVDYVGDVATFEKEFNDDIATIAFAVNEFGLPGNLKLSVHSGSDKFCIYPAIRLALQKSGAGIHVKTAGTTWLEELIGLAEYNTECLALVKEIYAIALDRKTELCGPYATVIDIDETQLPTVEAVNGWDSVQFVDALRHDQCKTAYNPNLRQLLHVGYKVAAEFGDRYYQALQDADDCVSRNVTENLWQRHIRPIFID